MSFDYNTSAILVALNEDISSLLFALASKNFKNRQSGFALITDLNGRVIGVVTDSDLRKFASKHQRLPSSISEVLNRNFIWISSSVAKKDIPREIASQMENRGWATSYPARYVPVLTEDMTLVKIIDIFDLDQEIGKFRDAIVVVGLGYVGLTFALAFAESGKKVIGIDLDTEKVSLLQNGEVTLFESGISSVLNSAKGKRLNFSSSLASINRAPGQASTIVICLPTPLDSSTKSLDLSTLMAFLPNLISFLRQGDTVVLRSTVPVGTGKIIYEAIERALNWNVGSDFYYVSAPERTVEGEALKEIKELPQIIGGASEACSEKGRETFEGVAKVILQVSSLETAELIKIAGNAYRDYTFAFANSLAEEARFFNVDVDEVIEKSNLGYPRSTIPFPSPGVGGPCLTKDPYLFSNSENAFTPIVSARKYNESVPGQIVDFILEHTTEKRYALVVGITFKGNPPTDDTRNSSNLEIAKELERHFKQVKKWDAVLEKRSWLDQESHILSNQKIDLIAVLNNHKDNAEFVTRIIGTSKMSTITLFDPWRLLNPNQLLSDSNLKSIKYMTMSSVTDFQRARP